MCRCRNELIFHNQIESKEIRESQTSEHMEDNNNDFQDVDEGCSDSPKSVIKNAIKIQNMSQIHDRYRNSFNESESFNKPEVNFTSEKNSKSIVYLFNRI